MLQVLCKAQGLGDSVVKQVDMGSALLESTALIRWCLI